MLHLVFLDKKNTIKSFEELGMIDPQGDSTKTKNVINNLSKQKKSYPEKLLNGDKAPRCVFVPDRQMMRKIMHLQLEAENKTAAKASVS